MRMAMEMGMKKGDGDGDQVEDRRKIEEVGESKGTK